MHDKKFIAFFFAIKITISEMAKPPSLVRSQSFERKRVTNAGGYCIKSQSEGSLKLQVKIYQM